MSRHFYLSTRVDHSAHVTELLQELKANGWKRTFEWENNEPSTPDEFSKLACTQVAGIGEADAVIVLLSGGRGTYTEVGAALAFGKPIILCAPGREYWTSPIRAHFTIIRRSQ